MESVGSMRGFFFATPRPDLMPSETPFTIETLLRAPLKHWFKACIAFVIPVVAALAAALLLPKTYESEAMIFVRLGRESVSLDPTATTGSTVSVLESRESEVNSIRDMLYSSRLVEKVVDRIGPETVLGDIPLGLVPDTFPDPPESDVKNSPRQKAIKFLTKKRYVVAARQSAVLVAGVEATSPELAQKILEVFLEAYKQMHSVAHQTPESNQFFAEQAELLQQQWQNAMGELRDEKEIAGVVSIEGMQDNLKNQTNETESRLLKVEAELMATKARLATLKEISSKPMSARGTRDDLKVSEASLASLVAEREALGNSMEELRQRAAKLNRDEVKIRQLEEQVALAKNNFAQYQELHEQTRIEDALLSNKFTNVRVVQEPSFIPKPVGPKRRIIAAAGLFAGLTGAILVSMLFEFFLGNSTSRRPPSQQDASLVSESSAAEVAMPSQGSFI